MTGAAEILRRRARALARPVLLERELVAGDTLQLLVVVVDGERLGLPVDGIAAIARAVVPVPLPRATAPVYGVALWRGRPLTVFVLSAGEPVIGADSRFVVLGDARRADVGLLVDEVDDVRAVSRASLTGGGPAVRGFVTLGITDDAVLVVDTASLVRERRESLFPSPDSSRNA